MKKTLLLALLLAGCTKIDHYPQPQVIDLGVKSTTTAIKSLIQANNIVTAEFSTTVGSKYSVQIIPFGSDEPVKKDGFTATDTLTKKVYNLADLAKSDYDLIFIDVNGKEAKHPIIIK